MSERPNKPSESKEKSAVPAIELARDMLCELSGPRGWHDTRESWLARGARRAGLTLRRARAVFYQEPIRLTADELLGIMRAHEGAHASVAAISDLAREADVRAGGTDGVGVSIPVREGQRAGEKAR
jgi:hypothetical protein